MRGQEVKAIGLTIVNAKQNKTQNIACFKEFDYNDLINWVNRNCKGCDLIEVNPDYIEVTFDDRTEIYRLNNITISKSVELIR